MVASALLLIARVRSGPRKALPGAVQISSDSMRCVERVVSGPRSGRDAWTLLGIVLAFVSTRLLWLALNPGSAVYWEESYRMVAAQELLGNPALSLLEYQADHYQGGSLVAIALAALAFVVHGTSPLTAKLPAVAFGTAIVALLFLVGRRAFGRSVGALAAAGYVAGPPLVAWSGLVVMGSHHE